MGKLVYILAVAALLLSCSKENGGGGLDLPDDLPYDASELAVGFSACGDWNSFTKADEGTDVGTGDDATDSGIADPSKTEFVDGDTLKVFGFYRKPDEAIGTVAPNFMYAQPVVYDGTNWNYSPVKYWPNNSGDMLDFYAYSPNNPNITVSPNTEIGPPVISYKLRPAGGARTDILYASNISLNKPSFNEKTKLEFKHLMGKLQFFVSVLPPNGALDGNGNQIEENNGQYSAYIQSMSYLVNTQGYFKFEYYGDGLPKWDVVTTGEGTTRVLNRETRGAGKLIDKGKFDDPKKEWGDYVHAFTAFLLPVTIEKLSVGLSTDGGYTHSIKEVTLSQNDVIEVVAGKVTTVHLKIQTGDVVTLKITVETKGWFEKTIKPTFPIY